MTLGEKIIADLTASMKAQDAPRTSTLRMVKAAMMNRQIEKGGQLDDEEISKLLRSLVKQRRDSIEQYEKSWSPGIGGQRDCRDSGHRRSTYRRQRRAKRSKRLLRKQLLQAAQAR
jgi:hypothetical protein